MPLFYRLKDLDAALANPVIRNASLAPVIVRDLLDLHKDRDAHRDGPAYPNLVRLALVGGPITAQDLVAAYHNLSPHILNLYSMTGAGTVALNKGANILRKPNSVGSVTHGIMVRIEGPNAEPLPPNTTGNIVVTVQTPLNRRIESGDIGYLDSEGLLYVIGRAAQMACRNSINLNLGEMQKEVLALNSIRDCIAFSIPAEDASGDQIILAVESADTFEIIHHRIRQTLPAQRQPNQISVAAALPRNGSDKLDLKTMRERALAKDGFFAPF